MNIIEPKLSSSKINFDLQFGFQGSENWPLSDYPSVNSGGGMWAVIVEPPLSSNRG